MTHAGKMAPPLGWSAQGQPWREALPRQ